MAQLSWYILNTKINLNWIYCTWRFGRVGPQLYPVGYGPYNSRSRKHPRQAPTPHLCQCLPGRFDWHPTGPRPTGYSRASMPTHSPWPRRPNTKSCHDDLAEIPVRWAHKNKANLRDLIAATGLVILLKLDSNRRFFSPCDIEIWWMTTKNYGAPLLYYFKLFASFQINQCIQTGVTVRKRPILVKIEDFFSRVTLQFDVWPWKTIGHLFNAASSFVHHFVAIGEFKLEL